jgi:hypothetical protein
VGDHDRGNPETGPIKDVKMSQYDPSEHTIQSKLVDILPPMMKPGIIRLSIPNGGMRHPRVGAMLKAEGLLPGSPDLVFAMHGGLTAWLEMKKRKGVLSDVQIGMAAKLNRIGHKVGVAESIEEALDVLMEFGVLR